MANTHIAYNPDWSGLAESFFQLLKRERIKWHIYSTRNDATAGEVGYIEMLYNSKRRHSIYHRLSPIEYEDKLTERLVSVYEIAGDSIS